MVLAYPGQAGELCEIVARDSFLDALNDRPLRVRILEHEPQNLDEALNIACRLEAFDVSENYVDEQDFFRRRNCQTWSSEEETNVGHSVNEDRLVERMTSVMQNMMDRCLALAGNLQGSFKQEAVLLVPPVMQVPPGPQVPIGSSSFNVAPSQQYFSGPMATQVLNGDTSDTTQQHSSRPLNENQLLRATTTGVH